MLLLEATVVEILPQYDLHICYLGSIFTVVKLLDRRNFRSYTY